MRTHQTESFTVFGGAYPTETHSGNPVDRKVVGGASRLVAVVLALVIGALMTTGAIAALKRLQDTGYGFQTADHSLFVAGPREILW
jgi:hypothetical protein